MSTPSEQASSLPVRCCSGFNAQGKPCGSPAQPGSPYCFRHDPERAAPAEEVARPVYELPDLNFLKEEVSDAATLRTLLARVIRYAAESPSADLARVHAVSAIASPLLRSLDNQEVHNQLSMSQAELRSLQEAHDRALTEVATLRSRTAPASTRELDEARKRAAELQGAMEAMTEERRDLERDLLEARQEVEMLTSRVSSEVKEREHLAAALADTSLVDRLCFSCIGVLRHRQILGPPAHEDDPDWPRR